MPALKAGAGAGIDTMIGTTREEMAAFYCIDQEVAKADAAAVEGVFASLFPSGHKAIYDEIRRMRASNANAALLGDLMSDAMFRIGSLRMAEARADQGEPAYVYQFDWQSPAGFESCHCLEVPFVFNNLSNWTDSPMLKGADSVGAAGSRRGDASRLDRVHSHRQTRSCGSSALAGVPARGPHDHALRHRDRAGQRSRRPWLAPTLVSLNARGFWPRSRASAAITGRTGPGRPPA